MTDAELAKLQYELKSAPLHLQMIHAKLTLGGWAFYHFNESVPTQGWRSLHRERGYGYAKRTLSELLYHMEIHEL